MSAKHGLAGLACKRGRLLGCCMTMALLVAGLAIGPAGASANETTTGVYIAAGDSISFGYTAERFNVNFPNEAPSFFEEGPVTDAAKLLSGGTQLGKGLRTINTSCPGETSNGFVGENTALGGQTSTEPNGGEGGIQGPGDWHPCAYHSLDGLPLHYSLENGGKEVSQLEEILSILHEGAPAHPVNVISLQIGANDELAALTKCAHEVGQEWYEIAHGYKTESQYGGSSPQESFATCSGRRAEKETFPRILSNLGHIIGAIDSTSPGGGHYTGRIVLQGFYNPDTFVRGETACEFCTLQGSDHLQGALNAELELNIVAAFPNVRFANPFPKFNPDSSKVEGKETLHEATGTFGEVEQAAICKYTEMCNPAVQKAGGKVSNPLEPEPPTTYVTGKDGDIHPSLAGAKLLGTLVDKAYLAP